MRSLQNTKYSINEKLENSTIKFFSQKSNVSSEALNDVQGRNVENIEMDMDGSESDQDEALPPSVRTDSKSSDSEEDSDTRDGIAVAGNNLKEHVEFHGGRLRRRAVFGNDVDPNDLKVVGWKLLFFLYRTPHQVNLNIF